MIRCLSILPLMLLFLSSCEAQNSNVPKSVTTVKAGDILIAGDANEDGASIGIEAPPDVRVEPLYGSKVLPNNRLGAEKIYATLIIVPPKGASVQGEGFSFDWPNPWVFAGTRVMTEELHLPHGHGGTKDHELNFELDGRKKTVTIEHQTFDLTKGRFFVVAMDRAWKPSNTQLKDDLQVAPLPAKTLAALRLLFLKTHKTLKP